MSHQTNIERVGPYWQRFITAWATPEALAVASTRDLVGAWSGLGYNRRALHLREAARRITIVHGGRVPQSITDLEGLPGIGPYTARAIAASAFALPVAPLDVNVRRVVRRVVGAADRSTGLQAAADALVDPRDPRRWLNAVMDLSAALCRKADPACGACPLWDLCAVRGPDEEVRRSPGPAFTQTSRWLRGRLLALATASPAGAWVPLPERLGDHDRDAVIRSARALAEEGFLEIDGTQVRVVR